MSEFYLQFPENFTWGAATSAYQIEGAWDTDGRGPSIWDTFSHQHGRIHQDHTGDTATNHYHQWETDVALMAELGLHAYRFSIAWTRLLPHGRGAINQAGLDFYDRLVDRLLARNIIPYPTLFHYDLPQALQDRGGWPKRDTACYLGDYARLVGERLGDRVAHWITINEPHVNAVAGYLSGDHAPGQRNPFAAFAALHHLLLAHGYAAQALRAVARRPAQIGLALNLTPIYPARSLEQDGPAVALVDSLLNRVTLDPVLKGCYPDNLTSAWLWRWFERPVQAGDLAVISTPIDFLGFNYYSRIVVRRMPLIQAWPIYSKDGEYSPMWEIYPPGMYDLLMRLHADYHHPKLVVLENGVPAPDKCENGRVNDERRVCYLRDHLIQVHRAVSAGVPVRGYFVWSLLDNFEWAFGYQMRFGLVHVDFETQQRTMKESGRWYTEVIRRNGLMDVALSPYSYQLPEEPQIKRITRI